MAGSGFQNYGREKQMLLAALTIPGWAKVAGGGLFAFFILCCVVGGVIFAVKWFAKQNPVGTVIDTAVGVFDSEKDAREILKPLVNLNDAQAGRVCKSFAGGKSIVEALAHALERDDHDEPAASGGGGTLPKMGGGS